MRIKAVSLVGGDTTEELESNINNRIDELEERNNEILDVKLNGEGDVALIFLRNMTNREPINAQDYQAMRKFISKLSISRFHALIEAVEDTKKELGALSEIQYTDGKQEIKVEVAKEVEKPKEEKKPSDSK